MSFVHATNSSAPNLVGFTLLAAGIGSAISTWATDGAMPILNFPGQGIADFSLSVATAITGYYVIKEGSPVAAYLAGALVAISLIYVGVTVDSDQAGRMAKATIDAAKGATSAATATATGATQGQPQGQYRAIRRLNPQQIAECEAGVLPWTNTEAGIRNCTIASDGNRWVWGR